MAQMTIRKVTHQLTDGSAVHDVLIYESKYRNTSAVIRLEAVTERDADTLIEKIIGAVNDHTNSTVRITEAA